MMPLRELPKSLRSGGCPWDGDRAAGRYWKWQGCRERAVLGQKGTTEQGGCLGNWDWLKLALDGDPSVQHPTPEGFALGLKRAALVGTVLQEGDFSGARSHPARVGGG